MLEPEPSQQSPAEAAVAQGLPQLNPDGVEQENGEQIDNVVPTHGYQMLPVVALGGSAGCLPALQAFFAAMPPDSGMAFVVIMHLAPEHESILAELIGRCTAMPTRQVTGRVKVEPNRVYVIPPAKHLSVADDHLILTEADRPVGKHVAVDLFFRTLADTYGPHAAAIVLSGADGDGAIGIKRIKERGGLTVVQSLEEAEQTGMPRSALATELVDWVLPAAEMPARLIEYWHSEQRLQLPHAEPDDAPFAEAGPLAADTEGPASHETTLHDILGYLRVRTGHDFSYYKRHTMLRRLARRMQVNAVEDPQAYLRFLRAHPNEPTALLKDLLISVTNFFRDREAFAALEALIPRLFKGKGVNDTVRVWVAACATGEEAYSVAMLLAEYAESLPTPPLIQVFATDLDERAIQEARSALYPEPIVADVSQDRLRRFFTKEHGGYRIKRELRERVLFALHDLLKDAPFSRLDMVTCRNLLIYLNRDAQGRALEVFHFALQAGGMLFLGSSESVDEASPLFVTLDKKRRIYLRREGVSIGLPMLHDRGTMTHPVVRQFPVAETMVMPAGTEVRAQPAVEARSSAPTVSLPGVNWSGLHYELVEQVIPPSVLVNQNHEIVHLSEGAGRFLRVVGGDSTMKLLSMVDPLLCTPLRAALLQAAQSGAAVETIGVALESEEQGKELVLRVVPARSSHPGFSLVIFQERQADATAQPIAVPVATPDVEATIRRLEEQLVLARAQLQHTVEQSQAAHEESKAANEELQAMNEELRSAGEELETGREELQSINEELNTVNQELKSNVDELARSNGDLQNLMAATQIATVFLDRELRIQRYTPPAVPLFNLIGTDLGRPLSNLTTELGYPDLQADARRVLTELATREVEVPHDDGRCFLARMLPYRTTEDRIAGVVMTFVDITRRTQAERGLRESEARFRAVSDLVPDLLFNTDNTGRLLWCNQRWVEYSGQTPAQAQGYGWANIIHPDDRLRVQSAFESAIAKGESYHSEHRLIGADGTSRWFLVRAEPSRDAQGGVTQWFGAKTDIDDFKRASSGLAASEERLRLLIENAREFAIFSTDRDLRVTTWSAGAEQLLGYREQEITGQNSDVIFTPEDRQAGGPEHEASQALAEGRAADERWHQRKDGSRFWGSGAMMAMHDPRGEVVGFVKILRDQTEARQTQEALEQGRQELLVALQANEAARVEAEAAVKAKDHFLAVLSHELRTPLTPVLMAVHLLARNRELPASAREPLAMIERNVQIEAHFIDDLLDVTKIARGKLEIACAPMDLHAAVRQAVEISADDLQQKMQQLTVALEAGEHQIEGDRSRLQQVFWNLLKNSAKFTPQGGSIHVVSRNEPGRIVVEVTDTGVGFEANAATRIFESFMQASEDIAQRFGGLGLGLAISKATVDAHGGTLRAQSEGAGKGATFTVSLPLS